MSRALADGPSPYSEASPLDILARTFRLIFISHEDHPPGRRREVVISHGWPGERPILTGLHMTPYFAELVLSGGLPCLSNKPKDTQRAFVGMAWTEGWRLWPKPYDGPAALETFGVNIADIPGNIGDPRSFTYEAFVEHWFLPLVVRRALELDELGRAQSESATSIIEVAQVRHELMIGEEVAGVARAEAQEDPAEA